MKAESMRQESGRSRPADADTGRPIKDYGRASPGEIMADIEQTRAHMDETLSLLGRKMHPGPAGKKALSLAGGSLVALAGLAGFLIFRRSRNRRILKSALRHGKRPSRFPWRLREMGAFRQALVATRLAASARKGKPTVIVVEPRRG